MTSTNHRSSRSRRPPPSNRRSALRSGRIGMSSSRARNQPTTPRSSKPARGVQAGIGRGRRARPRRRRRRTRRPAPGRARPRRAGRFVGGSSRPSPAASAPAASAGSGTPATTSSSASSSSSQSSVLARRERELVLERLVRARPQLDERPGERRRMHEREQHDAGRRPDRRADPEPVLDRRVVRVERRQDDVHVRERGDGQHEVRDPPAPRDRGEDDAQGEEREAVALVDAGRHDEEGEREDGQPDQQRQPVGTAGDGDQDRRRWPGPAARTR